MTTHCPNCQAWQEAHDAQVGSAMRSQMALEDENHALRKALIPFVCLARRSMERLGVLEEWKIARELVDRA